MAQRIAKMTTRKVSVWDVHVKVKTGKVDFSGVSYGAKLSRWLGWMLSEGDNTQPDPNLTYVDSLKQLLAIFQKRNEMDYNEEFPSTVFDGVPMLHFLKFSLRKQGGDHFFCFSTQFDDTAGEQTYIDQMYHDYGAMMEVVWRHCEGVTTILEKGITDADVKEPPDPRIQLSSGYTLAEAFLKLVDAGNVDFDNPPCFYNSNRDVSSPSVKQWGLDSAKLAAVNVAAGVARQQIDENVIDCRVILDNLLQAID